MRKFFVYIVMGLLAALLLTGCMAKPDDPATVPTETEHLTEDNIPAESRLPVQTEESIPDTTQEPTVGETEEPAATTEPSSAAEGEFEPPYLLYIPRADQSIYDGPGYDYVFVDTVRQRGTYTIVEEAADTEGNLWGRLKSGIGWVDLTEIRSGEYASKLISANYADENLLLHGDYYAYLTGEEYSTIIAFRAYGRLRDLELFGYELRDEGFVPGEVFCTLPELTEEMPLVAELAFPGDMTTYGIRFVDKAGVTHVHSIYISGRNGALVLTGE